MSEYTEKIISAIMEHAISESPRECCGLIVADQYVPCRNVSESPCEQFSICPEDWVTAEELGEIMIIVHSHPYANPQPSPADRAACEISGLPWLIVNPQTGEQVSFEPEGYQAELIGRPFVYGVHDCYSLVLDFYQRELGITLKHYPRDDRWGWWKQGEDLYAERFAECGFVSVETPEPNDLILMQVESPVANHLAVYLGDNIMLHHIMGQLSRREVFGGYWQKHTVKFLRYQGAAC
jgi:proteasome lid subunit RPN8/RPN11